MHLRFPGFRYAFLRNYGKVIGVDAQDFLIIPCTETNSPEARAISDQGTSTANRSDIGLRSSSFSHLVGRHRITGTGSTPFRHLYRFPFNLCLACVDQRPFL